MKIESTRRLSTQKHLAKTVTTNRSLSWFTRAFLLPAVCLGLTASFSSAWAQSAGDYRTKAAGNWNSTNTWETFNGSAWVAATATPTSADGAIAVLNAVSVTEDVTVDQVACTDASLTVNNGVTLTVANGTGTDFAENNSVITINGILVVDAGAVASGGGGNGNTNGALAVGPTGTITLNGTINGGGTSVSWAVTVNAGGAINIASTGALAVNRGNGGVLISISGTVHVSDGATIAANGAATAIVNSGGTFELEPATFLTGNIFTLSSGSTLKIGSTAGITTSGATGNIRTTTRTYGAGANYVYNGNAAQVTGNGLPASLTGTLTIANGSGVTLGRNTTINNTLVLSNGILSTTTGRVIVAVSGSVSGASASSYVNGKIQKTFASGAGQSFSFGIGDASHFAPVALNSFGVTTGGSLTAQTTGGDHPSILTSGIDASQSVNRFWTFTTSGGLVPSTYNATFNFVAGDVDENATTAAFAVRRFFVGGWTNTTTGARTATSTTASGSIETAGVNGFSDFAVGELLDPDPELSINDVVVTEGDEGTASATFTVSSTSASATPITVDYATSNGTAEAGSDYTAASGTLTFNPGMTSTTLTVDVTGDVLDEVDETYTVVLGNESHASILDGTGLGTITDDEETPTISVSPTASDITYGQTLSESTLSGGTVTNAFGETVAGTFTFTHADTVPGAGTADQAVTFTPADLATYSAAFGTASVTVSAKELTVTGATAEDKVYDGTDAATISGATLVGVVGEDDVTLADHTTGTFAQADTGTDIAVSTAPMTITGEDAVNYTLTQPSGLTADITAKELTVEGATAADKVYDGTDAATISGATLVGVVGEEDVTLADDTTGTFAQADVGTDIAVSTAPMTITGEDIGNYTLTQPSELTADITAKELTVEGATAADKVYDGTDAATISGATLVGVVGEDDVTLADDTTGTFAQADIGTDIAVSTAPMTITGEDVGNYTLTQPSGLTADITAKELTVEGATAEDKVYDGTDAATISGATLVGVVVEDDVTLSNSTTGTFAQVDIGQDIAVSTAPMTITGEDSGNYTLTQPSGLTADITAKELIVEGATAEDKVYDGTDAATITGATLVGVVGEEVVTLANSTTGTFAQVSVGTDITVSTAPMTLTGADAGNYSLAQPGELTADITAKELTVEGATAEDKVYDGTHEATISGATLVGVVVEDDVTLTNDTNGTFAQVDIGTDIAVSTAPMGITGEDAGNYTLTQPSGLQADITAKELTVEGATAEDKVYDGTDAASISGATLVGVVGEDDVTLSNSTTGTFAQVDIGTDIAVSTAPITITGEDAGNYTLTQPSGLTADITAKELTVEGATAEDKVYDGTDAATISGATLVGLVGEEDVTLANSTTGTFAQVSVGTDIAVSTAPMTLTGADAGNYSLAQPEGLQADITAKELTVEGATAEDKVYDGTDVATISGASLVGVVGEDDVSLTNDTNGTFAQVDIGTDIAVTTAPMELTGDDAGNYTLVQPEGLQADITAKELTVSGATAQNKTYDGNDLAQITGATLEGVVDSEDVVLTNATTGTFEQVGVGTNLAVTTAPMEIVGDDIGNYTLTQPVLTADITAQTLTVTGAVAADKVYDGTNVAQITGATLEGVVDSDDVTLTNATTGAFAQIGVGTNIAVSTAMSLTGADSANYALTQPSGLQADITAKELTVTGAVAQDKIFDQTTVAQITGATLVGVVDGDDVTLANATTGVFAQSAAGTNIAVSTAPMTITGADVGNYTLTQPTGLNADITYDPVTADTDGDGFTDAIELGRGSDPFSTNSIPARYVNDFDEDTASDLGVYRPSTGGWYIRQSTDGQQLSGGPVTYGWSESIPFPGDFDGDGLADITVYWPGAGQWFILQSSTGEGLPGGPAAWGWSKSVPVVEDYDGDGKDDLAVYFPDLGNWYIKQSRTDTMFNGGAFNFGWNAVIPVPADYDGDAKADLAVYDPQTGNWYVRQSTTGTLLSGGAIGWGFAGALPVPGDYDGDKRADLAVYDPSSGYWYVRLSTTGLMMSGAPINFGASVAFPVQADYDGDGLTDIAVYVPEKGKWFIRKTADGQLLTGAAIAWGHKTVTPALSSYQVLKWLGYVP